MDFKNGLPVADSICFNAVTTHQSFFVKAYQTRKEVVTKKCNHAEQHHNFCVFHLLQNLSVLSVRLFRTFL